MTQKRTGKRVGQFFSTNDIDDDHNFVELGLWENLLSAEGSSSTGEASFMVLSADCYYPTGAFGPETLGNCRTVSFLQEKPTWRRKHKLVTHCNFGRNLNEALRDRLVSGLRNLQIVVRSQPEVLQSCGKEPAVAMETSLCYASELQSALNPIPYCWQVHWKQQNNTSKTGGHPLLLPLRWKSHGQAVQRQPQVDFFECKEQTSYIIIRPWRFVSCWARTSLRKERRGTISRARRKKEAKWKKAMIAFIVFFYRPFWSS